MAVKTKKKTQNWKDRLKISKNYVASETRNLEISKIYISLGPVMFFPRKCMFKDGSFFLTLGQSGTML